MLQVVPVGEVGEILERYQRAGGFKTLDKMRQSFNEKLGEDGPTRQTWHSWRTGKNQSFNRPLLRLAVLLYPMGDWRRQLAEELLALKQ